jgi:acylphosphatase
MNMKHANITVSGLVQGVFFRDETKKKAHELGLSGYVENHPDGTVYIEAEGEESKLDELVAWCRIGPKMAKVSKVEVTDGPLKNFTSFRTNWG